MISFFRKKLLPSQINFDIGLATHIGRVRKLNEDSIICIDLSQIDISVRACAVADGLGGYEGGEIASKSALKLLFAKRRSLFAETRPLLANAGCRDWFIIHLVHPRRGGGCHVAQRQKRIVPAAGLESPNRPRLPVGK